MPRPPEAGAGSHGGGDAPLACRARACYAATQQRSFRDEEPLDDLWLSAANRAAGTTRGALSAEMARQQKSMTKAMTEAMFPQARQDEDTDPPEHAARTK